MSKCIVKDCNKKPDFNYLGEKKKLFCSTHKDEKMVNLSKRICNTTVEICTKIASFNFPGNIVGLMCGKHKDSLMINVTEKRQCLYPTCGLRPTYNYKGEKKPIYCQSHKIDTMVNVVDKKCSFVDKITNERCQSSNPSFNFVGEKLGIMCDLHKSPEMVRILMYKKCLKCDKKATYNFPQEKLPIVCNIHSETGMLAFNRSMCSYNLCNKRAIFNNIGEKHGKWCFTHKDPLMVDVVNKKCLKCDKRPYYNFPGKGGGILCIDHKEELMISVKEKCNVKECYRDPYYNFPSEIKGLVCRFHIEDGMIAIKNKCQFDKCKEKPVYGFENKKKQFCYIHKKEDMINLDKDKKCSVNNCDKEFCIITNGKKFCESHIEQPIDLSAFKKECGICNANGDFSYLCNVCRKYRNKKEMNVVEFLKKYVKLDSIHDSSIMLQGCSKKRPDIYYELPKHCVIVEVDENQHKNYEAICEKARMNHIVNGIGGKYVIFIRYNPDKVKHKEKIIEISTIDRLNKLLEITNREINMDYTESEEFIVKEIKLYYDCMEEEFSFIDEKNITKEVSI